MCKYQEQWLDIENYENLYQVSSYGRVRSLKRNTTNGKILKYGYSRDGIWKEYGN